MVVALSNVRIGWRIATSQRWFGPSGAIGASADRLHRPMLARRSFCPPPPPPPSPSTMYEPCPPDLVQEARSLMQQWCRSSPTPLNMSFWTAWARGTQNESIKGEKELESCRFLLRELRIRIAHTMQGLCDLHPAIQSSPSYHTLFNNYCQSIFDLDQFARSVGDRHQESLGQFRYMLSRIHSRHSSMVMGLSSALLEWKESDPALFAENQAQLNLLLDRIFLVRIGVRVLISQHILLFGGTDEARRVPRQWVGLIDSECQPSRVAREAAEDARFLAQQSYIDVPEVTIVGSRDSLATKFPYITSHLHHIVFELTKNALRATIENTSAETSSAMPRITIVLAKGDDDLTLKISDVGGGVSRTNISKIFDYSFTTARRPDHSEPADLAHAPLAGFGYGLPLSRQYARYLGGDVQIIAMDGYGVDAYVYLKLIASNTVEVFPASLEDTS